MNAIAAAARHSPWYRRRAMLWTLVAACLSGGNAAAAPPIPEHPLITSQATIPLSMLVVGRDHTLFYEAYNDASDIDGDGTLDTRFKPQIVYYGLFDPSLCYSYTGSGDTAYFQPASAASAGKCPGKWSGNWLNYVTTSRIDALRKVFYGGRREVDTATQTILRRAYIPQDAHSWAKEYTSEAVDGYKISDYTPFAEPTANTPARRHFFGNLTSNSGTNCATLSNCSNLPPLLSVVTNSTKRVWEWASKERPVLDGTHGGTLSNYTVRVEVCTTTFNNGCKRYPNGSYKPVGLLHDYGESDAMLFGLLTGSYNKNRSGGVLRKIVSSFKSEVNPDTGQYTANATIVNALNALRIRDYNNGRKDQAYRSGWVTTRAMNEAEFVDWGNPIGEMMYEGLRYFAGKGSATSAFSTSGGYDQDIGLSAAAWEDPYQTGSVANARWCTRANMLVVSGINPSFDSDQVPGCYSGFGSFTGDLSGFNASELGDKIAKDEPGVKGSRFIGQSGTTFDSAPTAKNVTSLGDIRGLAPEDPTKQGSYYSAAAAYFGKTNDLQSALTGDQTVDTYAVVLSSPLPRIEAKTTSGNSITLVPFAKTVGGSGWGISNVKGAFQPTNQIVDFYVETIANSTGPTGPDYNATVNSGRYYAKFRINFEDVEQGADHDMDVIVVYEITAESDGTLKVKLTPEYQAGSMIQNVGYVISGTTKDGSDTTKDDVYLVVQDENVSIPYFLNVPPSRDPGYCDKASPPADCGILPNLGGAANLRFSERVFSAGTSSATLLKDPLWYAAKWGGFVDDKDSKNKMPDLASEWDTDGNGVPDTYFLVQNPLKLRDSLKRSLDTIVERSASAGNITSNGQQIDGGSRVFQTRFNSVSWDGELFAYPVTSTGVSTTPAWKATDQIPVESSRKILYWKDATTKGEDFLWAKLTSGQQTALASEDVLKYLRGDQTKEVQNGGTYRNRKSATGKQPLGDLVHSSPYYVKDTDTVYVGGNDGMLHAFKASTGDELFGYIPGLVFPKLAQLPAPAYTHTFFVDGDIAVSTRAQTPDRNYLVASTGRGAKGLFALDVTAPDTFGAPHVLWEYNDSSDSDLGYVLGRPQIGILENGTAAAILGNGYNSTSGKAVLYVLDLVTGAVLAKLDTLVAGDNGMSTPGLWDSNGNGKIDTVYAGDLKGNVWRFNLSSSTPSAWQSQFLSGTTPKPLFTSLDSAATPQPQPITAQISVAKNTRTSDPNYGKTFVFFGTGRYVYSGDPADMQVQTWYGLIDEGAPISSRSELKQRTFASQGKVGSYVVRVFSTATEGDMTGKKGWYVDLSYPMAQGERIVTRSALYQFLEPVLLASSIVPDPDPCRAGGGGFVNAIDPFTGGRLNYSPFDLNDDGKFDGSDKLDNAVVGSFDPSIGMPGEPTLVGDRLVVGGSSGDIADIRINTGSKRLGRLSWREILGD